MSLFFVSYDLRKPGRDYSALYSYLGTLGAKRILESTFCLNSSESAEALREKIRRHIDGNDGLIVSEVTDWASFNTRETPNDLNKTINTGLF